MMKIKLFCIVFFLSGFLMEIFAQNKIEALGEATPISIKLRWGPSTSILWSYANEFGYTIEREVVVVNGKLVKNGERKVINRTPIKPASQASWELLMDIDDYVGVAAQALFGESLEVTEEFSSEMVKVIQKSRELENRFSFALFAADNSSQAAELSGLYYEDVEVSADIEYLYRIYANVPQEVLVSDTGYVYMGINDFFELPSIPNVSVEFEDKMAMISWNTELFSNLYNAFWVERSDDDGQTFSKITDRPIVNTYQGKKTNSRRGVRLDSLPSNNVEYHYRVLGINAFGRTSPPSDTVSGQGLPFFRHAAAIISGNVDGEGKAIVEFEFPEEGKSLLKSFDLVRQDQQTNISQDVVVGVGADMRRIVDDKPAASNYYIIRANDIYGRKTLSFPYLIQTEDSIPPLPPQGLTGSIDTLGYAHLQWGQNEESDIRGYKLYRSNFENGEYIQLPGSIVTRTEYVDTITLETLTETIYYKIKALDTRFNPSDYSGSLELKKPDKIPPVQPVFRQYKSDTLGIMLQWALSTSQDVEQHLLYRRSEFENTWSLITVFDDLTIDFYYDKTVSHRTTYAYTVIAVDDDRLESVPAIPITIKWINPNPYPPIQEIYFDFDRELQHVKLSWTYNQPHVEKFLIYKSVNGQPLSLLTAVTGDSEDFSEKLNSMDGVITYQVIASFDSGEQSGFSKRITIRM